MFADCFNNLTNRSTHSLPTGLCLVQSQAHLFHRQYGILSLLSCTPAPSTPRILPQTSSIFPTSLSSLSKLQHKLPVRLVSPVPLSRRILHPTASEVFNRRLISSWQVLSAEWSRQRAPRVVFIAAVVAPVLAFGCVTGAAAGFGCSAAPAVADSSAGRCCGSVISAEPTIPTMLITDVSEAIFGVPRFL